MEQVTTNPVDDRGELPVDGAEAGAGTRLEQWTKPAVQVIPLNEALTSNPTFAANDSMIYYS